MKLAPSKASLLMAITITITLTLIGITGCAAIHPPPVGQLALAKAALENAAMAGAPAYAPVESRLAAEKLAAAQKASADKDFPLAIELAEQSQLDVQVAMKKMQAAKSQKAADDALAARREAGKVSQ